MNELEKIKFRDILSVLFFEVANRQKLAIDAIEEIEEIIFKGKWPTAVIPAETNKQLVETKTPEQEDDEWLRNFEKSQK